MVVAPSVIIKAQLAIPFPARVTTGSLAMPAAYSRRNAPVPHGLDGTWQCDREYQAPTPSYPVISYGKILHTVTFSTLVCGIAEDFLHALKFVCFHPCGEYGEFF